MCPLTWLMSGWKRLLLAEGPRQVLNAITLYSVAKDQNFSLDIHQYQEVFTTVQGVVMSFMLLTIAIWALTFIRLVVAAILYWPLLCHIRGNLKEYCCRRVDKRISQLLVDRRRRRFDQKPDRNADDPDSNTLESGKFQPTLPNVELDNDGASVLSMPLYPLTRTNTNNSQRGLLSRTETSSGFTNQRYLNRSNTGGSDISSLSRANTGASTYDLPRAQTPQPALVRQPTLPQLAGDFVIPQRPAPSSATPPPRMDTRTPPASRNGSLSSRSAAGLAPPSRSYTNQSFTSRVENGFGPPPRSNTYAGPIASPRRPESPFDSRGVGYSRAYR